MIPLVEKTLRVRKVRLHRAIAGNSMGGMNSLVAGLSNLDLFSDCHDNNGSRQCSCQG